MNMYSIYLEVRIAGKEKTEGKVHKNLREVVQTIQKVAEKFKVEKPAGKRIKEALSGESGDYLFSAEGKFEIYARKVDGATTIMDIVADALEKKKSRGKTLSVIHPGPHREDSFDRMLPSR